MLCVNFAFNAMLPCVDSHLSLAGTPAILSMVTWEDGSKFLQLPSPFSRRGNPGPPSSLLSQSGSWGVPGADDAFTSSISGSCCFPTLQPYLHSTAPQLWDSALTGIDLREDEHHSPLSLPQGRNPQHWRWATVSYTLHFTHTALCSHQCQVRYEESQSLI